MEALKDNLSHPGSQTFAFKKGLEDVKWGSVPITIFCLVFIFLVTFQKGLTQYWNTKIQGILGFLFFCSLSNLLFYIWWRTPRRFIVDSEGIIGKRVLGGDLRVKWSEIDTLRLIRFVYYIPTSGLKVISHRENCKFLISSDIPEYKELLEIVKTRTKLANPNVELVGF